MDDNPQNIYNPDFVEQLFSQMSGTYDRVNTITSFGFSVRWRRQCAAALHLQPAMKVIDLMTGMGESWPFVLNKIGREGELIALDFCPEMIHFAKKQKEHFPGFSISILQENALQSSIPDHYADAVISTFGLKTFSPEQLDQLAAEVWRILKPGGTFAMVEVSKPGFWALRYPYLFYLKKVIPKLGKLFLGNPESYRMLGIYTELFENSQLAQKTFKRAGLEVQYLHFFAGCATGIYGTKQAHFPNAPSKL